MSLRQEFMPKPAAATRSVVFEFLGELGAGETISTQSVAASVWSGTDASPSAMISGSASASGTQVSQMLTGGVEGVVYNLTCTITTSTGQTLTKSGYLAIAPSLP